MTITQPYSTTERRQQLRDLAGVWNDRGEAVRELLLGVLLHDHRDDLRRGAVRSCGRMPSSYATVVPRKHIRRVSNGLSSAPVALA